MRTADWWCVGEPMKRVVPVVLEDIAADGRKISLIPIPEKAAAGSFNEAGSNLSLDADILVADFLVKDKYDNTHINRVL